MSQVFLGQIDIMAFNFAPRGAALCNGQLMAIAQNQALFALLGTTYGGNGIQTFALPNLQGRAPMYQRNTHPLGQAAGTESTTLQFSDIPLHNHTVTVNCSSVNGTTNNPSPTVQNQPDPKIWSKDLGTKSATYSNATPDATMRSDAMQSVSSGGQPHENRQPFLVLNFVIWLQGIFPSRN